MGIEKNEKEAVVWFQKAADKGNAVAQYHLSLCYEEGNGIPQDIDLAQELIMKSKMQGYPPAVKLVKQRCANMRKRQRTN